MLVLCGCPGKENDVGENEQIQEETGAQQPLAKHQQMIRPRMRAQAAPEIQPQPPADPPVRPGKEDDHHGDQKRDDQNRLDIVCVQSHGALFSGPVPLASADLAGGSMESTVRQRGSSTGSPLR